MSAEHEATGVRPVHPTRPAVRDRAAAPANEGDRVADPSRATAADPDVVRTLGAGPGGAIARLLRRLLLLVLVAAAVAGAVLGVRHLTRKEPVRYVQERTRRGDLVVTVTATGTLQPRRTVQVGAEVSGRVLAVHADYNQRVTAGQVLVEIDPELIRARVREARANRSAARAAVRQAHANLDEARVQLRRTEQLVRGEVATEQQLDTARAAVARAEAALASAEAQVTLTNAALSAAQTDLSRTEVRSPIDGVVLSRSVEPGQAVASAFQTPVFFTIAEDLRRMELRVDVDEADIGRVREGQQASFVVDAYPGRRFEAALVTVRNAPRTVQNVVTYEAVLAVDNEDLALRPGMTATATIVAERRRAVLLVPSAALRFTPPDPAGPGGMDEARQKRREADRRRRQRVWVLRDGAPAAIVVQSGPNDGRVTEITGGALSEGARVIVDVQRPTP